MFIEYARWYSAEYWEGKKTYKTPDGKTEIYHGPALDWQGFDFVANALAPLVPGKTLLDIGCGGGALAARFLKKGYDAYGIDVSKYAIDNCMPEMKGRLVLGDITTVPELPVRFPQTFDVVLSCDLWEHIYFEDLDRTFDWVLRRANKYLFFLIAVCTNEDHKQEFVHQKGTPIPAQMEGTAVSGHIHIRRPDWWARYFRLKGLRIDWQRAYIFQAQREKVPSWQATAGWHHGSTWILRR